MEKIKAIENHENLCWKCLESKNNIHKVLIPEMGYGSQFDGESTEIHLCEECYQESIKKNKNLWSMKEKDSEFSEYDYEQEMLDYIKELPIQGRQLVENTFNSNEWSMNPQDWIDYELKILSHEKCNDYGFYSQEEIKAYEDRFPTCQHTINCEWEDKLKGCYCPLGSSGEYNQKVNGNISDECYGCKYYIKRDSPIKEIEGKNLGCWQIYMTAKLKAAEYAEMFE